MWTRAGGWRIVTRGGTAEGAVFSHQRDTVTLATTCPPLCWLRGPGRLTAPHKIEHDTGHGGTLGLAGESEHGGMDKGFSDGKEFSGGGKIWTKSRWWECANQARGMPRKLVLLQAGIHTEMGWEVRPGCHAGVSLWRVLNDILKNSGCIGNPMGIKILDQMSELGSSGNKDYSEEADTSSRKNRKWKWYSRKI